MNSSLNLQHQYCRSLYAKKKKKYNAYIIVCLICSYYSLPKTTVICTTRKQSLKLIWSAGDHVLNIRVKQQACSATWSGGVSILTVNILDQRLLSMWSRGHFCNDHYYPTEPKSGAKLVWTPSCTILLNRQRLVTLWSGGVSVLTVTILNQSSPGPKTFLCWPWLSYWTKDWCQPDLDTLLYWPWLPYWTKDWCPPDLETLLYWPWLSYWIKNGYQPGLEAFLYWEQIQQQALAFSGW